MKPASEQDRKIDDTSAQTFPVVGVGASGRFLTSIKGILQISERSASNSQFEKNQALAAKAAVQVNNFNILVDQLLDGTNIQAGELKLQKTYFSLLGLVQTCIQHATEHRENVQLEVSGSADIIIYADRDRLKQAVLNLITNAIKYSPESDVFKIPVLERDGLASVHVTDFGIGVDRREVSLIFDRFYRINEDNVNYPGLGLGLFIAAEIIRRHKGEIGVESEPGKGSTFWFSIPVKEDANG